MTVPGPNPTAPPSVTIPTVLAPNTAMNGNFTISVGGYHSAGLLLHILATVLTLGLWAPIFVMYLIGWRSRMVSVHVLNGVVVAREL